jgi:uncharacterized repeat protein (TIGR01451 family)
MKLWFMRWYWVINKAIFSFFLALLFWFSWLSFSQCVTSFPYTSPSGYIAAPSYVTTSGSCAELEDACDVDRDGDCDWADTFKLQRCILVDPWYLQYCNSSHPTIPWMILWDFQNNGSVSASDLVAMRKYYFLWHFCWCPADADTDGDWDIENDCEPDDPNISSLEPEICDGIDNDCDALIDENAWNECEFWLPNCSVNWSNQCVCWPWYVNDPNSNGCVVEAYNYTCVNGNWSWPWALCDPVDYDPWDSYVIWDTVCGDVVPGNTTCLDPSVTNIISNDPLVCEWNWSVSLQITNCSVVNNNFTFTLWWIDYTTFVNNAWNATINNVPPWQYNSLNVNWPWTACDMNIQIVPWNYIVEINPFICLNIYNAYALEWEQLVFNITLSSPAVQQVNFDVNYAINSSPLATPGVDFDDTFLSWPWSIGIWETDFQIVIDTYNTDNRFEDFEYVDLIVFNVNWANWRDLEWFGEIQNIDLQPTVHIWNATWVEWWSVQFPLTLDRPSDFEIRARVSTTNGTAIAWSDYTAAVLQTVTFLPGVTGAIYNVSTINNWFAESTENFRLSVINFQASYNQAFIGNPGSGFILDNDPLCGSGMLQLYYRPQAPTTGDLCTHWFATSPVYSTGVWWTWWCNLNGWAVSCSATERFCWDWLIGTGIWYSWQEQCDDGNLNSGDGCDNVCQLEMPQCDLFGFKISPNIWLPVLSVTWEFSSPIWFQATELTWWTWSPISNPSSPSFFSYGFSGIYTWSLKIQNTLSWALNTTCFLTVIVSTNSVDGQCGAVSWQVFYGQNSLHSWSSNLCVVWWLTGFVWPTWSWAYNWWCNWENWWNDVWCSAQEERCGDGYVNGPEQCDGTYWCTSMCDFVVPECSFLTWVWDPSLWYSGQIVTWTFSSAQTWVSFSWWNQVVLPVLWWANTWFVVLVASWWSIECPYLFTWSYCGDLVVDSLNWEECDEIWPWCVWCLIDDDNDWLPSILEDACPNWWDANYDWILDKYQSNVWWCAWSWSGLVTIEVSSWTCSTVTNVFVVQESELQNYDSASFPYGLIDFVASWCSLQADVTLYYHNISSFNWFSFYKYNSTNWYYIQPVNFDSPSTITYTVTDNWPWDDDTRSWIIRDPIGPWIACTIDAAPSSGASPLTIWWFNIQSAWWSYSIDPGNGSGPYIGTAPPWAIGIPANATYALPWVYTATLTVWWDVCTWLVSVIDCSWFSSITITWINQLTCQTHSTLLSVENPQLWWTYEWSDGSTWVELLVTWAWVFDVTVTNWTCFWTGTIEVFDTCDIQVDKRILSSTEYVWPWWSSYPDSVSELEMEPNASGSVMNGDWYVYRVMVRNNGLETATWIRVSDMIPSGLEIFQVVNNGYDAYEWVPDYFSGSVNSLWEWWEVYADLWVSVSWTWWSTICNEVNGVLMSRSDTMSGNNTEESCVDVWVCAWWQTCVWEIYGKDFSSSNDWTEWISEVTCVVEADCAYWWEYSGTAASLEYSSVAVPNNGTILVPYELWWWSTWITYANLWELATLLWDEDTNYGDTFINYNLVGNTLFYRVWRHRAECRVPTCAWDLLRTYVPAWWDSWSDINSLWIANQTTIDGDPVIASEDNNNHQTNGQCTCDGQPECWWWNGCNPECWLWSDPDCAPVCWNWLIEVWEVCDDNNGDNGDGCSSTCQLECAVTISGNAPLSCIDWEVELIASGADNYVWSNGSTGSTILVTLTWTYTVTWTTLSWCIAWDTTTVVWNITNLSAIGTGTETSACWLADGTITVVWSPISVWLEYQLSGWIWQGTGYFTWLVAWVYTVNVRDISNQWCGQTSVMVTISDGLPILQTINVTWTTQLTCQTNNTLLRVEWAWWGWMYEWSNGSTWFELPVTGAWTYGVDVYSGWCMLWTGEIIVADTCDIQVDKRILSSTEYVWPWWSSYPDSVSELEMEPNASGSVMNGDWYVYRVMVRNNGLETATWIRVSDMIPSGLEIFQVVNNGYDAYEWVPDYFSGSVNSLWEWWEVYADLWVRVSWTWWSTICNEVNGVLMSRSDTMSGNNTEESCVDVWVCTWWQTCVWEIYGKDFSTNNNGLIRVSEVTCVVEADCGYWWEYSGTAAGLIYSSMWVANNGTAPIPLELWWWSVTTWYSSLLQLASILNDMDYDNGDTFQNYNLLWNTLFYRVWRHRAECRVPTCAWDLLRTYVPAWWGGWSDINSLWIANQSVIDGQSVIASEDNNNHQTNGQCTCDGQPECGWWNGCNPECGWWTDPDCGWGCEWFSIEITWNEWLTCNDGEVTLSANGGSEYSWSNGSTGVSITVTWAWIYSVFGTWVWGCTGDAQVSVTWTVTNLTATGTGTNTSACGLSDGTVTVVWSPMSTWLEYQLSGWSWQGTGYFTWLAAWVYTVNVRDISNQWCGQTSVMVTISDGNSTLPTITITWNTQLTCDIQSTLLSVEWAGWWWTYLWSNSSTAFELPVTWAGIYGVTVSSGSCVGVDTIEVIDTCFPIDCSPDNTCNPSCGIWVDVDCNSWYTKSLLQYSWSLLQYQISWTVVSWWIITLFDTLSTGSQFTGLIQVNSIIWTWNFIAVTSGNTILMQWTNQWTWTRYYQILYSVQYTNFWIPNPVCNSIQQVSWSVIIWTWMSICDCPDGRDYCTVWNSCVPWGTPCSGPNPTGPYCTNLITTITPSGTWVQYQCIGSWSSYQVTLSTSSWQVIATWTNDSGSFALVNSGTYTVVCAVQWDTWVQCWWVPLSCNQVYALTNSIGWQLGWQSPYFGQVPRTWFMWTNPCTWYIDLSINGLITELTVDMTAYFISTMVALYGPVPNGTITNGVVTSLSQNIQTTVMQTIQSGCQETCRDIVNFAWYCGNGIIEAWEQCEPPWVWSCRSNCTRGSWSSSPSTTTPGTTTPGTTTPGTTTPWTTTPGTTTPWTTTPGTTTPGTTTPGTTTPWTTTPGTTTPGTTTPGTTTPWSTTPWSTTSSSTTPWWLTGWPWWWGGKKYIDDGTCTKSWIFDPKYCVKTEPKCSEIDPPSIMIGEYLPYRWDLEMGNEIDEDAKSCGELDSGKFIPWGSVLCTFELYNGASQKSPIHVINNIPCFDDKRNMSWVTLFDEMKWWGSADRLWSNWLMMSKQLTRGIVWEYQIVLSRIDYTVCNDKTQQSKIFRWTTLDRVCAMNFAVSDAYLLHQWTIFSVLQETNLRAYRKVDWRAILSKETMRNLQQSVMARYPNTNIGVIMWWWVEKQNNRAVQKAWLSQLTSAPFRKVPTEPVYIYDWWVSREPLIIRGSSNILSPITVIVYNADLIIEGSLKGKHMYLVPDGKILFASNNCDERDVVEWIFMTNKWVLTNKIRNDNLQATNRCEDGRLLIEWILVSPDINRTFIESRRGNLDEWFDITTESQEQKVYESASILLRSTPREWKILPPGANSLLRSILLWVTGSK